MKNRILQRKIFLFSGFFLLAVMGIIEEGNAVEVKRNPSAPTPGDAPHDIDGNGRSDILVKQKGSKFLLGYWKNGTTQWNCTNIVHKADWKIPGTYDMDGDGKADLVVISRSGEGKNKSVYAGFYKGGIDKEENWVSIGNLQSTGDDDWQYIVGNLSEMKNFNSIVCFSPKRGKLGAWLNGTDQWIEINSKLNKHWALVGCGDFEGSGKKSILMSLRDGVQYFVIDLEGQIKVFGSPGGEWRVCSIGDFDGNGKDSVLFFHPQLGLVAKYAGGLFSKLETKGQLNVSDWKVIGSGRYSGAKTEDILVQQISTGKVGYYVGGDMSKWHEVGDLGKEWEIIP